MWVLLWRPPNEFLCFDEHWASHFIPVFFYPNLLFYVCETHGFFTVQYMLKVWDICPPLLLTPSLDSARKKTFCVPCCTWAEHNRWFILVDHLPKALLINLHGSHTLDTLASSARRSFYALFISSKDLSSKPIKNSHYALEKGYSARSYGLLCLVWRYGHHSHGNDTRIHGRRETHSLHFILVGLIYCNVLTRPQISVHLALNFVHKSVCSYLLNAL
jgi:hypothetical protein